MANQLRPHHFSKPRISANPQPCSFRYVPVIQLIGSAEPNYNKHFPRSFLLNYGRSLENLPDDKILKDWNCEWLTGPKIANLEFASTLKDNLETIVQYKGTVFTDDFVNEL